MPNANAHCSALLSNLTVCNLSYKEHGIGSYIQTHVFVERPYRKTHLYWQAEEKLYCGVHPDMVYEWEQEFSDAYIREQARANRICLSCLKQWMYIRERVNFFATPAGRRTAIRGR